MVSSVTTAVPSGLIHEWCILSLYSDFYTTNFSQCANSSRGTTEADFDTICCDGEIIDTSQDIWAWPRPNQTFVNLKNLVCCRLEGPQMGGIGPIPQGAKTSCQSGTPTPLASLAATNTANAQVFQVTYTSASFGTDNSVGDFIPTNTPYCLWADTAHGMATTNVTVPPPHITTLPPPTTDALGFPITTATNPTATSSESTTVITAESTATLASATSTSTSQAHRGKRSLRHCVIFTGLLAFFLLSS